MFNYAYQRVEKSKQVGPTKPRSQGEHRHTCSYLFIGDMDEAGALTVCLGPEHALFQCEGSTEIDDEVRKWKKYNVSPWRERETDRYKDR